MSIRIAPLSAEYLEQACHLVDECFPGEPVTPHLTVRESMDRGRHLRPAILKEYGEEVDFVDYWIALDGDRVVGTTGLFDDMRDKHEAAWLEWHCVHPDYRGQGIGARLLDTAIDETRNKGRLFLRVYTEEAHPPTPAHHLYEGHGFTVTKKEWNPRRGEYLLFLEKRVDN